MQTSVGKIWWNFCDTRNVLVLEVTCSELTKYGQSIIVLNWGYKLIKVKEFEFFRLMSYCSTTPHMDIFKQFAFTFKQEQFFSAVIHK